MMDGAIRAILVDDGQRGGALLKLLNGYARTTAASAEMAMAKLRGGGVDLVVVSCAAKEASLLIPHIKGVPHLLIEWRTDGPFCVSTSFSGGGSNEPLPAVIAELVEQVAAAHGIAPGGGSPCEAVVTVTEENAVEGVSPAAERMFQCRAHEVVGHDAGTILPLCLPAPECGEQVFETVGSRGDGTRFPMALSVEEMVWGGKRRYIVTLRDLSARTDPLEVMAQHAVRDDLTGLYHPNTLIGLLDQALARACRFETTVALLLVDIDHLAIINEMHGREMGDQVLVAASRMLGSDLRDVDRVVRWNGDEMAIILQETSEEKGVATAERIRRSMTHLPVTVGTGGGSRVPVRVTLSVGVALYPTSAEGSEAILACAYSALSEAKRRGCDCVVNFDSLAIKEKPKSGSRW